MNEPIAICEDVSDQNCSFFNLDEEENSSLYTLDHKSYTMDSASTQDLAAESMLQAQFAERTVEEMSQLLQFWESIQQRQRHDKCSLRPLVESQDIQCEGNSLLLSLSKGCALSVDGATDGAPTEESRLDLNDYSYDEFAPSLRIDVAVDLLPAEAFVTPRDYTRSDSSSVASSAFTPSPRHPFDESFEHEHAPSWSGRSAVAPSCLTENMKAVVRMQSFEVDEICRSSSSMAECARMWLDGGCKVKGEAASIQHLPPIECLRMQDHLYLWIARSMRRMRHILFLRLVETLPVEVLTAWIWFTRVTCPRTRTICIRAAFLLLALAVFALAILLSPARSEDVLASSRRVAVSDPCCCHGERTPLNGIDDWLL